MSQAQVAVRTLSSRIDMLKRRICQVMLSKSLFLFYHVKKHGHIAFKETFSDLIDKASRVITSLACDDDFFKHYVGTREELHGLGFTDHELAGMSWVDVVTICEENMDVPEADEVLPVLLQFHAHVVNRQVSHLRLTAANMERSTWLAARVLCEDPIRAVEGANFFFDYLIRRTPAQLNGFERSFLNDPTLMAELEKFKCQPGEAHRWVCVWRHDGAYENLFKFLVSRFGGAPDSVLQCEGVHARWKWITSMKRGLKFPLLNATLKLFDYIECFGDLPSFDTLYDYFAEERAAFSAAYRDLCSRRLPEGHASCRSQLYADRFNLKAIDVELLKEKSRQGRAAQASTPTIAWGNYVRFLFKPGMLYCFSALAPDTFAYIVENKSLPNRETPAIDTAIGRFLNMIWYKRAEEEYQPMGGTAWVPMSDRSVTQEIEIVNMTIAEMSKAFGYYPQMGSSTTERELEIQHEQRALSHEVGVYTCERARVGDDFWGLVSHDVCENIETYFWEHTPIDGLTNMALARRLQIRDGLTDNERDNLWSNCNKQQLMAHLTADADAAGDVAAAVAAAARGRGRGRGGGGRAGRAAGGGRRGRGRGL